MVLSMIRQLEAIDLMPSDCVEAAIGTQ